MNRNELTKVLQNTLQIKTQRQQVATYHILTKFKCDGCGRCCKIPNVMLAREEVPILANNFGLSPNEFNNAYMQNRLFLNNPCPFLRSKNKCLVYKCRPGVCKAYPFRLDIPHLQSTDKCQIARDIKRFVQTNESAIIELAKTFVDPELKKLEDMVIKKLGLPERTEKNIENTLDKMNALQEKIMKKIDPGFKPKGQVEEYMVLTAELVEAIWELLKTVEPNLVVN